MPGIIKLQKKKKKKSAEIQRVTRIDSQNGFSRVNFDYAVNNLTMEPIQKTC
jgi:hypothetical protein